MQSAFLEQSFNKAKKYIKNGDKKTALLIYQKVLDKFPKNLRAINALNNISQQSVLNEKSSINEQNYIVQLYNNGQIKEGITECERLIKIYPYDFYIYNFLGIFFHALKKYLLRSIVTYLKYGVISLLLNIHSENMMKQLKALKRRWHCKLTIQKP